MRLTDDVIQHYDLLVKENNDPVHDPKPLRDYMDKWDGQAFIDKMKLDKNKSVLEIGIGTGRLAVRVAPLCGQFYGIDISTKTIERARENLSMQTNVNLIGGDFLTFDFPQSFDVIYSSLTFMHIKEKQTAINKVAALLKGRGKFVLSIDKNRDGFIDTGTRKITVFPDTPAEIKSYILNSGLLLRDHYETEFAHIFVRKPGTGCVTMINDHLYEGRFSPRVNGKRIAKNIYATTREECEEKLKVLIAEMKKEIAEIKANAKNEG